MEEKLKELRRDLIIENEKLNLLLKECNCPEAIRKQYFSRLEFINVDSLKSLLKWDDNNSLVRTFHKWNEIVKIKKHIILIEKENSKSKKEITNKDDHEKLQEKLDEERNKRRTYPIEFLRKVKSIDIKNIYTQKQCIIEANRELGTFKEEDLLDKNNDPTEFLIGLRRSYRAQKNSLKI